MLKQQQQQQQQQQNKRQEAAEQDSRTSRTEPATDSKISSNSSNRSSSRTSSNSRPRSNSGRCRRSEAERILDVLKNSERDSPEETPRSAGRPPQERTRTGKMNMLTVTGIAVPRAISCWPSRCRSMAQEATFEANVDRSPVGMGEQFTLSFDAHESGSGWREEPAAARSEQVPHHVRPEPVDQHADHQRRGVVNRHLQLCPAAEGGREVHDRSGVDRGGRNGLRTEPIDVEVVKERHPPQSECRPATPANSARQLGDNLFLRASRRPHAGDPGRADQPDVQALHACLGCELRGREEPDDDGLLGGRCGGRPRTSR